MSVNFNDQLDQIFTSSGVLTQKNTGGLIVANGNNIANKPAASSSTNGLIRYNTDNNVLEAVINGVYYNLAIVPTGPTALVNGFLPINGSSPMTGTLGLISGSSTSPGLYFNGNTSTGFFSPLANTLSISANGIEALRFNADSSITVYSPINLTNTTTAVTQPIGDSSNKVATTAFVANSAVLPGTVTLYGGTTPPVGYLECNGAILSTSAYANLFLVLGYNFGGSGSNFYLPDMRGQFARGWDHGAGVDTGRVFGSTQTDVFGSHSHSVNDPSHAHPYVGSLPYFGNGSYAHAIDPNPAGSNVANTGSALTGLSINSTGGSETRPKNVALMYIIKY